MRYLKTTFCLALLILLSGSVLFSNESDDIWAKRNTKEDAKKAYEYFKNLYETVGDYDSAWKYARATYHYADIFVKNVNDKKAILTDGKNAADKATKLAKDRAEGFLWYGVCLGGWAEANGIMESLSAADKILNAASKAIQIDPAYDDGGAFNLRARVYHKAPGIISVGDEKKAEQDYQNALKYGPNNRGAHRFYAEFLLERGRKEQARDIISKGLKIEYDPEDGIAEDKEIALLKELQKKAN